MRLPTGQPGTNGLLTRGILICAGGILAGNVIDAALRSTGQDRDPADSTPMEPTAFRTVQDSAARGDVRTVTRLVREARGLTQADLGRACGYPHSAVSPIERGRTGAHDVRMLHRIEEGLDMPPHLLGISARKADQ